MSKKDEALKLALEALESGKNHGVAIDVLRRALAEQPAQQPYDTHAAPGQSFDTHSRTSPASKPWVGLDDTDLAVCDTDGVRLARYWERLLREKNA